MGSRNHSTDFDARGVAVPRSVNARVDPILRAIAELSDDRDRCYIRRWIGRWVGSAGELQCARQNVGPAAVNGRIVMRTRMQ